MTISRRWKIAGAVLALVALLVVVTLVAYARVQAGQRSANRNSNVVGFGNVRTSGTPYGYGYPYGYAPGYPYGYAYGYSPGYPYGYSSPVPGYPYNYGNPYGGSEIGYGYGPPRAMSVSQLPGQVGCPQPPYGYSVYGPCGFGAYTSCLYYMGSPACNQQLANGTRCGYGYASCITVQLSCRLPVAGGGSGSGGFIAFPQGDFTLDPGSNVAAPDGQNYGVAYDAALSRWLPVSYSLVSPDGKRYAYGDRSGVVHSVDASSGADTVLTTSGSWQPIGYLSEGVYITHRDGTLGLWLAAPGSASKQVTPNGSWQVVADGAGYGTPSAQYPPGATNDVIRVNLSTGAVSQWFRRDGAASQVIGVDRDGHALITAVASDNQFGGPELWSTTSASAAVKLVIGFEIAGAPRSDKYGLWVASAGRAQGTYLLTSTSNSSGGPYPIFDRVSSVAGTIAGPCLG